MEGSTMTIAPNTAAILGLGSDGQPIRHRWRRKDGDPNQVLRFDKDPVAEQRKWYARNLAAESSAGSRANFDDGTRGR